MLAAAAFRLFAESTAAADRVEACGPPSEQGFVCKAVFNATHNVGFTKVVDRFAIAVNIIVIIVIALIVTRIVRLIVRLVVRRMSKPKGSGAMPNVPDALGRVPGASGVAVFVRSEMTIDNRAQRAKTLGAVARSVADVFVWAIALILIFEQLGIALGPFIAGAGIIGVALGFGAQSLVKDFLSGVFMLAENQFGVGDVIDTGFATGVVRYVTVRSTVVRDDDGVLWYIPNGKIDRVGNRSSIWERVLLDVEIDRAADTRAAIGAVEAAITAFGEDPTWSEKLRDTPQVSDIVDRDDNTQIEVLIRTSQLEKWEVTREARDRIRDALSGVGIALLDADAIDPDEDPHRARATEDEDDGTIEP